MDSVSGRVSEFLRDEAGRIKSLVLDCGCEVRFWPAAENIRTISQLASTGSLIQVDGAFRDGENGRKYLQAVAVTNLTSKKVVNVLAPVHSAIPGTSARDTPTDETSLARQPGEADARPTRGLAADSARDFLAAYLEEASAESRRCLAPGRRREPEPGPPLPQATGNDAATVIERAYDSFQRIQAILAYLHIVKRHVPGISQFLQEAKHTYEQALNRYEARDFEAARELGAASNSLSLVVELIISRTLRSDTTYPSMVPPPPQHGIAPPDSSHLQDELDQVEGLLSRIRWVLEHGTLPLEERTQARRIASWGDALFAQARHMQSNGSHGDTAEFLHAARDAANAAEHICRRWYVAHAMPPRQGASGELQQA
jgi:hypothetical protein